MGGSGEIFAAVAGIGEDAHPQGSSGQATNGHDAIENNPWFGQVDPMFLGDGSDIKEKFDYGAASGQSDLNGEQRKDDT